VRELLPGRRVAVCSRNWNLLAGLRDAPEVQLVHSAGSHAQLRALLWRLHGAERPVVSVHERLLTPVMLAALHDLKATILTWPVNTPARLRELVAGGVDGAISDNLELLRQIVRQRSRSPAVGRP
jgi:glycerophosphoryl diester phosphodiesterase